MARSDMVEGSELRRQLVTHQPGEEALMRGAEIGEGDGAAEQLKRVPADFAASVKELAWRKLGIRTHCNEVAILILGECPVGMTADVPVETRAQVSSERHFGKGN